MEKENKNFGNIFNADIKEVFEQMGFPSQNTLTVEGGVKNMKGKHIIIQNQCNNVIAQTVLGSKEEAEVLAEYSILNNTNNYDPKQGDVVIYELIPVEKVKIPLKLKFKNLFK